MSKSVNIDDKHRVEQENHWQWQKWFWIGTVILGVAAQIALVYIKT